VPPPLNPSAPAQAKKIARGDCPVAMPPNRSIEWTFYEKLSFYGLFCGPQICQKCIGGRGSAPDPAGGADDATPDTVVDWGGGHPLPISLPFVASILAPSALRFSCPLPVEAWCPPLFYSWLRSSHSVTVSNTNSNETISFCPQRPQLTHFLDVLLTKQFADKIIIR